MDNVKDWDNYFFDVMSVVSTRSKDPSTKVGCVISDSSNRIISVGYNGFPSGMKETAELWSKPAKYDYVVHAEVNAILNIRSDIKDDLVLYVPFYPCSRYALIIAAYGKIKTVKFKTDYYKNEIAEKIFAECGIQLVKI
jgi:dCMP deaminase